MKLLFCFCAQVHSKQKNNLSIVRLKEHFALNTSFMRRVYCLKQKIARVRGIPPSQWTIPFLEGTTL